MRLLTEELKKQLPELYSQEEVEDPKVILRCFTPDSSWVWLIMEGSKQEDGDWLLFAKVYSHFCPQGELGYVMLSELENSKGPLGTSIERDLYFKQTKLSQCK